MIHDPLPRDFYARKTEDVARGLLGKILARRLPPEDIFLEGRIVEVEAYGGEDDPASHAYRGLTRRNAVMFQQVGLAYVYFIYGNHYCLNTTARSESAEAGAVLIRALQPLKGIPRMTRNRGLSKRDHCPRSTHGARLPRILTNGPGKLAEAMGITGRLNGTDLTDPTSELLIGVDPECSSSIEILSSKRIGVSVGTDRLWRFFVKGNEFVSR